MDTCGEVQCKPENLINTTNATTAKLTVPKLAVEESHTFVDMWAETDLNPTLLHW